MLLSYAWKLLCTRLSVLDGLLCYEWSCVNVSLTVQCAPTVCESCHEKTGLRSATETDQNLEILDLASVRILLFRQWTTKVLIRLHEYADSCTFVVHIWHNKQVFSWLGSCKIITVSTWNEPSHDKTNKMTCAPSEDSDQPGHPPSLISLRCPHEESLGPYRPIARTAKTLIRLGVCPGWSGSSLGKRVILLVLSCDGSNLFLFITPKYSQTGFNLQQYCRYHSYVIFISYLIWRIFSCINIKEKRTQEYALFFIYYPLILHILWAAH